MRFKPGQSGNPAGRPPGRPSKVTQLRSQIEEHLPAIIQRLVREALDGDTQAASLLLSRALPPARAESVAQVIANAGTTSKERAEAVTQAALDGAIPASVAADFMAVLQAQARVIEVTELEERIAALEMLQ